MKMKMRLVQGLALAMIAFVLVQNPANASSATSADCKPSCAPTPGCHEVTDTCEELDPEEVGCFNTTPECSGCLYEPKCGESCGDGEYEIECWLVPPD